MRASGPSADDVGAPTQCETNYEWEAGMLAAALFWWLGSIVFLVIWVAIAFWPARVAGRKGHSFVGYFIFSLIFFPAALLVAYMVSDRTTAAIA